MSRELTGCSAFRPGPSIQTRPAERPSISGVRRVKPCFESTTSAWRIRRKNERIGRTTVIRWELELKNDRAQVCGQVLFYLEGSRLIRIHGRVLRGYVDFLATT